MLVVLSQVSFVSGITAALIVLTALSTGLYLVFSFRKTKSKQTLALAFTIIAMGWIWASIAINFILNQINSGYLDEITYILIFVWAPSIGLAGTLYIVVSILKQEIMKPIGIIILLVTTIYLLIMYVFLPFRTLIRPSDIIKFTSLPNELPDASASGFLLYYSAISIFCIFLSGLIFFLTGLLSNIPLVKFRGVALGSGFLIFSFFVLFDTIFTLTDVYVLFFVRLLVISSFFILTLGITSPEFILKRLHISK
jgi:hypothetical protein